MENNSTLREFELIFDFLVLYLTGLEFKSDQIQKVLKFKFKHYHKPSNDFNQCLTPYYRQNEFGNL